MAGRVCRDRRDLAVVMCFFSIEAFVGGIYKDLRKVRGRKVVSLQPRHKGCLSGVGEGHHQIEVTGIVPVPRSVAGGVENARKEPPLFVTHSWYQLVRRPLASLACTPYFLPQTILLAEILLVCEGNVPVCRSPHARSSSSGRPCSGVQLAL